MIAIRNVSFAYPGAEDGHRALQDIDLDIGEQQFIAFLGPNGSGKSSLSRLLNGIELPSSGEVSVDGRSTRDPQAIRGIRRSVQIVFQNPENQQVGISVGEDIAFGLSNIGWPQQDMRARIQWALDTVGLDADYDRLVTRLSGGEKQKLALAAVLALAPRYLILDEATSMLDPASRRQFVSALKQARSIQPFTLIYITHHVEEVTEADRLVLFHQGRIRAQGTPDELLTQEALLNECGLELPYLRRLAIELRKRGIDVPDRPDWERWRGLLCASS